MKDGKVLIKKHAVTTAELIYQIGQLEGQIIHSELSGMGIRMEHARLLHYVSEVPGTNQVNLANYLNVQAGTLTNMIKKLEKQNLITRRIDSSDTHQRQVFLLPEGEKAAKKVNQIFLQLNETAAKANIKDYDNLRELLEMLKVLK